MKKTILSMLFLLAGIGCFAQKSGIIIGLFTMSSELHDDKTAIAKARLKSVFLIIEKI